MFSLAKPIKLHIHSELKIDLSPSWMLIVCKWSNSHTQALRPLSSQSEFVETNNVNFEVCNWLALLTSRLSVAIPKDGRRTFTIIPTLQWPNGWTPNLLLFMQYPDFSTGHCELYFRERNHLLLFSGKFTAAIYKIKVYSSHICPWFMGPCVYDQLCPDWLVTCPNWVMLSSSE